MAIPCSSISPRFGASSNQLEVTGQRRCAGGAEHTGIDGQPERHGFLYLWESERAHLGQILQLEKIILPNTAATMLIEEARGLANETPLQLQLPHIGGEHLDTQTNQPVPGVGCGRSDNVLTRQPFNVCEEVIGPDCDQLYRTDWLLIHGYPCCEAHNNMSDSHNFCYKYICICDSSSATARIMALYPKKNQNPSIVVVATLAE